MQIQKDLPRGPSQVLSDNIYFEDALGRVKSLPFEFFRHWEVRSPVQHFLPDDNANTQRSIFFECIVIARSV